MLSRLKTFFKRFWGLIVGLGIALTYFFLKYKKKSDDLAVGIRDSGKQLAEDVDEIRQGERAALENEAQHHVEKMDAIKKKYQEERDKLDAETVAEADRIIQQHGDDPMALAEELSRVTGFKIITPKD